MKKPPFGRLCILLSTFVLGAAVSATSAAAWSGDLLPNPSSEQIKDDQPVGWKPQTWAGRGAFRIGDVGRTGKRSLLVESDGGADAAWTASAAVEPFTTYRLSGWIKTENVKAGTGLGALLNVHNLQPTKTQAVVGTSDWTQVEVVFDTEQHDAIQVNCLLGGWGQSTGRAWYDDLRLEPIAAADWKPSIAIDAARRGPPVSKYIYGQFIEHLGRCIYGGIWAEMVEDRKFFHPVGAEDSPWSALGDAGSVTMRSEGAFVGDHSPVVALAGDGNAAGLVQKGLGLRKGTRYVGRIWLAGTAEAGRVRVSLVWGEGAGQRQTVEIAPLTSDYRKTPLEFQAGADTDDARLEIAATGSGSFTVGTVSLMPADNVHGMRADTLALLKELDSPIYRWPGGNFVSGYNWKDGIGDPDRRPTRKNPAWKGIETNDFGIDEFMVFCRELKTEPYVVVNSGLGGVELAVEKLEYANGAADTPMGRLRAANGHAEPYGVHYWGIGNEMYGGWQLGHMPLEQYIQKNNQFADALRAKDPSVALVAVGSVGPWTEGMLTHAADHMDLLSEHFYCGEKPSLVAHVRQIPDAVRRIAEAHRRYRKELPSLEGTTVPVALDEWNYWYGPHVFGELGTRYFLKDGLGIAAGLNEFARCTDVYFMANYAQTVNVIGCIKTTKTAAAFATTGLVLKLYRQQFGEIPLTVTADSPLDVAAAFTGDGKRLTVAIVNPTMRSLELPLAVSGVNLSGSGRMWQMAGSDPQAYNQPGEPPRVTVEESAVPAAALAAGKLPVAPCSVTLFALDVRDGSEAVTQAPSTSASGK